MTDAPDRTVAALVRILVWARDAPADEDITARHILTALRGLGWRPTEAQPAPDWKQRDVTPADPSPEYLAERARLLGEPQP